MQGISHPNQSKREPDFRCLLYVFVIGCLAAITAGLLLHKNPPHPRFVPVDVRVVDGITSDPILGAMVFPMCLGGTPYATNDYQTDANGVARVTSRDSIMAARITGEGYHQQFVAFMLTNGAPQNVVVKMLHAK